MRREILRPARVSSTDREVGIPANRAWILGAGVASAIFAAFAVGFLVAEVKFGPYPQVRAVGAVVSKWPVLRSVHAYLVDDDRPLDPGVQGRWTRAPLGSRAEGDLDWLRSVGYLSGYEPAGAEVGVTIHLPRLVSPGLNLYCSGHGPAAELIGMDGEVRHRWSLTYEEAFAGRPVPENRLWTQFWRRVRLLPEGDLLAIFDGLGMIRIGRDSELIWSVELGIHHDVDLFEGRIYTLGREVRLLPRIHPERSTLEDFILVLDGNGNLLERISVLEALEDSPFAPFLEDRMDYGDILHTNSIEVLDGSSADKAPFLRGGNILISMRNIDTIAIVDPRVRSVVWALSGQWIEQHDPTIVDGGHILLFDNKGRDGLSKVIEFDPLTQEVRWAFEGTQENGFQSATCGASQRLPNGNTLIVESDSGRAFELTPGLHRVWEFSNPARAGEEEELVATLFDLVRIGHEEAAWLEGSAR